MIKAESPETIMLSFRIINQKIYAIVVYEHLSMSY